MKKQIFLACALILLSGCFDTEFNFKTTVHRNGSLSRETKIDGRGARFFKAPDGPGWTSKTWKTPGEQTFVDDASYHIEAQGRFKPNQTPLPDYQLDVASRAKDWAEPQKKRLDAAGIKPPYHENLYSRNQVKVSVLRGWFTVTTFYEEKFENAGIVPLLLMDLKEDVRHASTLRGENFTEVELDGLARLRLTDEILPEIRFHSEVSLPGKVISSNARQREKSKAVWDFTMKDFQDNYSTYTLKASSQSLRLPGIIFVIGMVLLSFALFVLVIFGVHLQKQKNGKGKTGKKKT